MEKKTIQYAREWLEGNRAVFLENAIRYCAFNLADPEKEQSQRYERLLRDMAEEGDREAAVRYMLLTLCGQAKDVFDSESAIRLLLQTDAVTTYQEWLDRKFDDMFDEQDLEWLKNEPVLRIAELARGVSGDEETP